MSCRMFLAVGAVALCSFVAAQDKLPAQTDPKNPIKAFRTVKIGRASVLNTRDIYPQIGPSFGQRFGMPENPPTTAWTDLGGETNSLPVGGIEPIDRVTPVAKWPAVNATGWNPADPTMAVGPNHVIVTTNATLAFFSKTGTQQFSQDAGVFFNGIKATTFQFDPRVVYDRIAQRWVLIYDEQNGSSQISKILVAVSDDADPNGTWFRYSIEAKLTVGTSTFWLDYPGFGYNRDGYVITGNMFGFASGFAGAQFIVLPKAPMLTGSPVTASYLRDANGASAQVADCFDATVGPMYAISRLNSTTARIYAVSNITTTPTLNFTNLTIPSAPAPTTAAPSTPGSLDTLDGRMYSASFRSGRLVASHTVSSSGVNRVRWYDFNLNSYPSATPTLIQSGNLIPPTGPHFHMPAIASNGYDDISVIFTRSASSGTGAPADAMAAGRKLNDAAGTMGTPVLLASSQSAGFGGSGTNRWGDYFSAGVDPTDDATFWGVAMVANSSGGWITMVNSWTITPPAALTSNALPSTITGGTVGTGTITLDSPAPQLGYVVSLTSSNPGLAAVPATVTVPGGSATVNYSVTTQTVGSNTPITITASLRGVTRQANTTLVPAAAQVSGTVTLGDYTGTVAGRQVSVEIRNVGSSTVVQTGTATLNASGQYSITTSLNGNFDVFIKSSHWLRKVVSNVSITSSGATGVNATLKNGDVNNDNTVSLADFALLRNAFGSTSSSGNWNADADLNGDGTVSLADFAIMRNNFGQVGDN